MGNRAVLGLEVEVQAGLVEEKAEEPTPSDVANRNGPKTKLEGYNFIHLVFGLIRSFGVGGEL